MLEEIFSWRIEGLGPYGFLHILFIILTIVSSIILCKISKSHDDKQVVKTVFIIGLIFLVLELYKQLFYNTFSDGLKSYNWSMFPFQLCSTPMYLCLLSIFFKENIRKSIYSFLAFFGFVAGLTVMIFPETVIIDEVTISIQSLLWHGLQCVLGCYLIKTQNYGENISEIKHGIFWFIGLLFAAIVMNYTFEVCKTIYNIDGYFNLFYISPYYECNVVILKDIWNATNYHFALLCYIIGVILGTIVIFYSVNLFKKHIFVLKQKEV